MWMHPITTQEAQGALSQPRRGAPVAGEAKHGGDFGNSSLSKLRENFGGAWVTRR